MRLSLAFEFVDDFQTFSSFHDSLITFAYMTVCHALQAGCTFTCACDAFDGYLETPFK